MGSLFKKINTRDNIIEKNNTFVAIRKDWDLYLLLVPGLLFLLIFRYAPMYGIIIAFQDFNIFAGIQGSTWVGFDNFIRLFHSTQFLNVFRNTLIISVYKILFLFPLPIILAILLNEIGHMTFKKTVQTVIYLPHFISWVIVSGLFFNLLSINGGIVNSMIKQLGGEPIAFFIEKNYFRSLLVITAGWKEVGWGTIIYLAAITGIDPQLYEAAIIDGANKFQQIWNITVPGITSTIVLMFILRIGSLLDAGMEQILTMYNPVVYEVADIIGTYVYRIGLGASDYSFATAVGLFNSIISLLLIMGGNYLSRRYMDKGIW